MDINSLIYSECHNPIKIRVYDGIKNAYVERCVPCGKCYHCKITRINEWVTRMVIESNYNKYVYFGTLTYGSKKATIYHDECMSIMTDFNKNKSKVLTPLILRKDHVQKFFKRLRKNTGVKIQYAYCGEYGNTYSRPHYHYIIWSNEPISKLQIYKAWSAPSKEDISKRIVLGRVEHRDIKNNAYPALEDPDNTHVFKYVCKYIQKFDFNFEKLTNYKEHLKNYENNFDSVYCKSTNEYIFTNEELDDFLLSKQVKDFDTYKKVFSPFFHCSKKPAIGYRYLQEHIGEFQNANFKLFGLSKEYIFPLYFIRKTKESLCPLKAQSETNDSVCSYSRLPKMEALLNYIQDAQRIAEDSNQIVQLFRNNNSIYTLESVERIQDLECLCDERDKQYQRINHYRFNCNYLTFVDSSKRVAYVFCGDYYALYNTTTKDYIGIETLENVQLIIRYYYEQLKRKILLPLYAKSEISSNKKASLIADYGGEEKFNEAKKICLRNLLNRVNRNQEIYKKTKPLE